MKTLRCKVKSTLTASQKLPLASVDSSSFWDELRSGKACCGLTSSTIRIGLGARGCCVVWAQEEKSHSVTSAKQKYRTILVLDGCVDSAAHTCMISVSISCKVSAIQLLPLNGHRALGFCPMLFSANVGVFCLFVWFFWQTQTIRRKTPRKIQSSFSVKNGRKPWGEKKIPLKIGKTQIVKKKNLWWCESSDAELRICRGQLVVVVSCNITNYH